jgi:hypothetical protein
MKKILFLLPLLLFGCKISQKIVYQTSDLSVPNELRVIPISVDMRILKDNRTQIVDNNVLFTAPRQTSLNGERSCINSEQHYKKDSVTTQITRLIAEHFNKVKLFNHTTYNQNNSSGYYLTGTLNSFYGKQKFSSGAAVGAQFGLIGALATAGIKTPGKIIIEIADLKLFNKDGVIIKDFGSFYKEYDEDFSADAYCWCIYRNINEKLKDFNSHLADKIRSDLADISF